MRVRRFHVLQRRLSSGRVEGVRRRRGALARAAAVALPLLAPASAPAVLVTGSHNGEFQEGDTVTIRLESDTANVTNVTGDLTVDGANVPAGSPNVTGFPSEHNYSAIQDGFFNWEASGSLTNESEFSEWSASGSFTVANVAPVIESATLNDINDSLTVNEGQVVSLAMTSTDPGADGHTFGIDVDGSPELGAGFDFNTSGTRVSQTVFVAFTDDGAFTVNYAATDDDTTTNVSRALTVLNVAPTIETALLNGVDGNIEVDEGDAVTAAMTSTDPGGDSHAFSIDVDGGAELGAGGDVATSGFRASQQVVVTQANDGAFVVNYAATDDDETTNLARTLTVRNVAPTITSATLNGQEGDNGVVTVMEGDQVLAMMTSTDPGADDHTFTIANTAAGVDPANGGTRSSMPVDLTQADETTFVVNFDVMDDDDTTTTSRTLVVENADPAFSSVPGDGMNTTSGTLDFELTSLLTFNADATDPGVNDVLTFTWDLDGDGDFDDFTGAAGSYDYTDIANQSALDTVLNLAVRVDDGDGGVDTASFLLSLVNVTAVPEAGSWALLGVVTVSAGGVQAIRRRLRNVQ